MLFSFVALQLPYEAKAFSVNFHQLTCKVRWKTWQLITTLFACVLVCCFTLVNLQRKMENMAIKNLYLDHKVQLMCYYNFWHRHHELICQ